MHCAEVNVFAIERRCGGIFASACFDRTRRTGPGSSCLGRSAFFIGCFGRCGCCVITVSVAGIAANSVSRRLLFLRRFRLGILGAFLPGSQLPKFARIAQAQMGGLPGFSGKIIPLICQEVLSFVTAFVFLIERDILPPSLRRSSMLKS